MSKSASNNPSRDRSTMPFDAGAKKRASQSIKNAASESPESLKNVKRGSSKKSSAKTAILVLGMHRSGTSAITRLISMLGVALPKVILGAGPGNEGGHWEPLRLVGYHDRMLNELGSSWHDWRLFDLKRASIQQREQISNDITDLIAEDYGDAPVIVLKEPRISRFAPFFFGVLKSQGYGLKAVVSFRNPLDVFDSLIARDNVWPSDYDRTDAALLWLTHMLEAERTARSYPHAVISYEAIMTDPVSALQHVVDSIDLVAKRSVDDITEDVRGFIDTGLRHHARRPEDVLLMPQLTGWVADCFQALRDLEACRNQSAARRALDRIRNEYLSALPLLETSSAARRAAQADACQARLELETKVAELERQQQAELDVAKADARAAHDRFVQSQDELETLRRDYAAQIEELSLALNSTEALVAASRSASTRSRCILERIANRLNPLARNAVAKQRLAIVKSGLFDVRWYQKQYPDVAKAGVDPIVHYLQVGYLEGRNPSRLFDTMFYLRTYHDVANAGVNPLLHYAKHGAKEGRRPSPQVEKAAPEEDIKPVGLMNDLKAVAGRVAHRSKLVGKTEIERRVAHLLKYIDHAPQAHGPSSDPYDSDRMKITWVIPDFMPGAGGHMTIFRIASHLEKFGHDVRLVIQNPTVHTSGSQARKTINEHFQPFNGEIELFTGEAPELTGDALIATDRFTTYPVNAMGGFVRKFYFVQDYETLFYPTGTESLLSEATYNFDFDCLCAGPWLESIMRDKFGRWAMSWPLAYDSGIYNLNESVARSTNRIAFYARYVTPRRAVELGFIALSILHERGLDFEVDFFGCDLGDLSVPYKYADHGILSSDALASLYRSASVGMVFSATNHSLVNKEMMACGLPVIDLNVGSTKAIFPPETMEFAQPTPEGIANSLEVVLKSQEKQTSLREAGLSYIEKSSWEASARQVESALRERLNTSLKAEHADA